MGSSTERRSVFVLSQPTTVLRHYENWKRLGVDTERWWDQVFHTPSGQPFPLDGSDRRFPCPEWPDDRGVPWEDFRCLLNHKFQALVGASHGDMDVRPISELGLAHISTYLFGNLSRQEKEKNNFVTRKDFYEPSRYTRLVFGEWFYSVCFVVEKHLFHFWNSNLIWDFTSKETARKILREQDEASLLIKFSDTMKGTIIIAFRDPKGPNKEVDFLRMDVTQMYQVRVDQSLYSTDLQPIKQLLRAFDAAPIPLKDVLEEGKNQRDYYRFLSSGQLGDQPSPYDPVDSSELLLARAYPPEAFSSGSADSGFGSGGGRVEGARPAIPAQRPPSEAALTFSPARNIIKTILAAAKRSGRRSPEGASRDSPHDSADSCAELPNDRAPHRPFDFSRLGETDSGKGDSLPSVSSVPTDSLASMNIQSTKTPEPLPSSANSLQSN